MEALNFWLMALGKRGKRGESSDNKTFFLSLMDGAMKSASFFSPSYIAAVGLEQNPIRVRPKGTFTYYVRTEEKEVGPH